MKLSNQLVKKNPKNLLFKDLFVSFLLTKEISVGKCLQKIFIPFTRNIKNIPSVHHPISETESYFSNSFLLQGEKEHKNGK